MCVFEVVLRVSVCVSRVRSQESAVKRVPTLAPPDEALPSSHALAGERTRLGRMSTRERCWESEEEMHVNE